jgi:hypothetical protein
MGIGNLWSQMQMLVYNKSYLMNFRRWNYNCAFYYYYLIMDTIYKINIEQYFTFARMGNLLLPKATPLVSRFFDEMSVLKQRC